MRRVVLGLTAEADTVSVLGFSVPRRVSLDDERRLESAGVLSAPWERRVVVTGRDAARFLHNMLTQDITGMPVSAVLPAALADRKGHVAAELWVWREEESSFVLRIAAPYVSGFLDVLNRHRIMERVDWSVLPPGFPFLLLGPASGSALGVEDAAEAGRLPLLGDGGCWMRVSEISSRDRVVFALDRSGAETAGALPVGWDAFDRARIDAGRAWMGLDVDTERLVPEPAWHDHISYTKGCYLGQETLARLHYQGRLNWRLARFDWAGPGLPHGTELRDSAGARLGWITSVREGEDGCRSLGFLHRRVGEESLAVALPDGRPLTWTVIQR